MIDVNEFKKFDNIEKNHIIMAFLKQEVELKNLQDNIRKLESERNELFKKLTNVDLPKLQSRSVDIPLKPVSVEYKRPNEPPVHNVPKMSFPTQLPDVKRVV